jgi:hypothetical protein
MTGRVGRAKSVDTGIGTYRARLRQRGNLLNRLNVICPVQPRLRKYSCFHVTRLESISPAVQSHRGALAIVIDAGLDAVDAGAFGVKRDGGAGSGLSQVRERSTARRRTMLKRTVKACGSGIRCWC